MTPITVPEQKIPQTPQERFPNPELCAMGSEQAPESAPSPPGSSIRPFLTEQPLATECRTVQLALHALTAEETSPIHPELDQIESFPYQYRKKVESSAFDYHTKLSSNKSKSGGKKMRSLLLLLVATTAPLYSTAAFAQTPAECFQNPSLCSSGISSQPDIQTGKKQTTIVTNSTPIEYDFFRNAFNTLSIDKRKSVQDFLKQQGLYNSTIDGAFGQGTFRALREHFKGDLPTNEAIATSQIANILQVGKPAPITEVSAVEHAQLLISDVEAFLTEGIGAFEIEFAGYYQNVLQIKNGAYNQELDRNFKEFESFVFSNAAFLSYKTAKDLERRAALDAESALLNERLQNQKSTLRDWLQANLIDSRSAQVLSVIKQIDSVTNSSNLLEMRKLEKVSETLVIQLGLTAGSAVNGPNQAAPRVTSDDSDYTADSLYIFGNFTGRSQYIYKDFDGAVKMENATASVCLVSTIDRWQRYEFFTVMSDKYGASTYEISISCTGNEDVVVVSGYDLNRKQVPPFLAEEEFEVIHETPKARISYVKQEIELISKVYERDILAKSKVGYGAVIFDQQPLDVCHLYDGEPEDHISALKEHTFLMQVALGTTDKVIYAEDEIDAFQKVQRRQCGVVYSDVETLNVLLIAAQNNSMSYFVAPMWISESEIEQFSKQRQEDELLAAAIKETAEQNDLLKAEAEKELSLKAKAQEAQLQSRNGLRFNVLIDQLFPILEEAVDFAESNSPLDIGYEVQYRNLQSIDSVSGVNKSLYDGVITDIQRLALEGWEITSKSLEKIDYGLVEHNGRDIEGLIVKLALEIKNKKIGAFDTYCQSLAMSWDSDFMVWRSVLTAECGVDLNAWLLERKFRSQWLVK